jgi:3',5'-cyclic-AMP phosphodiesterase
MPGPTGSSESKNGKGKSWRVLQFTDTHFFGTPDGRLMGVDTNHTFRQVLKLAHEEHGSPDFYLLTGDLSQDESQLSYERFAEAAAQNMKAPAYYLPGNHDARPLMEAAFESHGVPFSHDTSFVAGNWQIILLDTQVEGEVGGRLSAAELKRLDEALSAHPDKHTLVTLHHHPLPVGSNWIDQIKVDNSEDFLAILDKHPQVRGVLCGHIHQEFETTRAGVRYFGTPSTCVQFKPNSQSFAVDPIPPGFRWMTLHADGTIETKVVRVQAVAAGLDMASLGY